MARNRSEHDDSQEVGCVEGQSPGKYLTGTKLYLLSLTFIIESVLIAIDGSILVAAIPFITSEFHTLDNIVWYGSVYLLTQMACQPIFGRIYIFFEAKGMYLISLLIFEIGSIICATAPRSNILVLGRAIAGCGAAGMLAGNLTILGQKVPLRQRPQGMAILTCITALAGMLGSTLGGLITDSLLTWRFCFWINLPFGVIMAGVVICILDRHRRPEHRLAWLEKLRKIDLLGSFLLASSLICLFLALEIASSPNVSWSNSLLWVYFVGFGATTLTFISLQIHKAETAVLPPRLFKQRTVIICCIFSFLYGVALWTHSYMLPVYFQAVQGTSATISGVYCLSFSIPSTLCILATGFTVTKFGIYVPFMWVGSLIYVAGSVLLYKLSPDNGPIQWIGYQVVGGIGLGLAIQITFVAVQVVVTSKDMPMVCSMEIFFRQLGGAIGISFAEALLAEHVKSNLQKAAISGLDAASVTSTGIGELAALSKALSPAQRAIFKDALNDAVSRTLLAPVVATLLAWIASWGMEWHTISDLEDLPVSDQWGEDIEMRFKD